MDQSEFSRLRRLLQRGRYRRALAGLARDPRPEDPSWRRLLAWARWHLGDPEGMRDAEAAVRLAPPGAPAGWAWQDLGALRFRAGDWAGAEAALRRALDHHRAAGERTGAVWALHGLGVVALHRGRPRAALRRGEAAWAEVRARGPSGFAGRALVLLSSAHRAAGELAEARFRARQALRRGLDPDDRGVALRALGSALRLAGRPAEGLPALERAAREAGEGARRGAALAELALALVALGREGEALKRLAEAAPLLAAHAPGRARGLVALAELARRRGREAAAARLLAEAYGAGPYPAMEEAPAFPELFALAGGRPRTRARVRPPPAELDPAGRGRLRVAGREVPLAGSGRALALLVFLALEGPAPWERAAEALWEDAGRAGRRALYRRVQSAAARARDLLASERAVVLEGGVLALEEGRRWRVREAGEAFLAGVWTEWAVGRREA